MSPRFTPLALVISALVFPVVSHAQWQQNGIPLSTVPYGQGGPRIVPDGAGGVIATFLGNFDVYAQRIDGLGVVQWTANGVVACTNPSQKYAPAIASDAFGGAVVAWQDYRNGNYDIFAQRINLVGVLRWAPGGVALCTSANDQSGAAVVSDGSGGAIVAWSDLRSGTDNDIYVQRIDVVGNVLWTTNGVPVCTAVGEQLIGAFMISDGAGGAIVTWEDDRIGAGDIYAQRIDGSGVIQWTPNGVALCTAVAQQQFPLAVSDGAGGAVVAWHDFRNGNYDIYAQRINASGAVQWAANGVALCTAANDQDKPVPASDGAGGAIVAWEDYRNGANYDIYAQRVSGSGGVLWTANGVPLCTAAGHQQIPFCFSDGSGGAIAAWWDNRTGTGNDIYAQRISASGAAQWSSNGTVICDATGDQEFPWITLDGSGGAVLAWSDYRSGGFSVDYAQRVDLTNAYWGAPEPAVTSVADIPGDQGGKVALNWKASGRDTPNDPTIRYYSIWRATDAVALAAATSQGMVVRSPSDVPKEFGGRAVWIQHQASADYYWEWIANQDAHHLSAYTFSAPTRADSTSQGPQENYFFVSAQTGDPSIFFDSNTMGGHSVDNLAPAAPLMLAAQRVGADVHLQWNGVHVADLKNYAVYRATSSGVTPVPGNFLAGEMDTMLVDSNAPTGALYYIVTAYDVHENQSVPSNEASVSPETGVENTPSLTALAVRPNHPNPFAGATELEIGLPAASAITVEVYDVAGRRVSTVRVPGVRGWQQVPLAGVDEKGGRLPSGVYFYRVHAQGETITRKMVIAR